MKIRRKTAFLGTLLIASLCAPSLISAPAMAELFSEVPAELPPQAQVSNPPQDVSIARSRTVSVNGDALSAADISSLPRLQFNLFDDARFEGVVNRAISSSPRGRTLVGRLADERGHFMLRTQGDILVGTVTDPEGRVFEIVPAADGSHRVNEIDPSAVSPCGATAQDDAEDVVAPDLAFAETEGEPATAADESGTFDLLVVYTPAARDAMGGTAGIEALIQLAVDETNLAYADSFIASRLRLVHTAEVDYVESGDMTLDLSRLRSTTDGIMDEVHAIRDQHGADLVNLIVGSGDWAGYAYIMSTLSDSFSSRAFSVVHRSYATGYYSFGHELGHNMGCHHDHQNTGSGLYSYSYGHHFGPDSNPDAYRTIMAYSPGTRIRRFSNPDAQYLGYVTGVPVGEPGEASCALTINQAASTIANWRQSVGPGPTGTPAAIQLDSDVYGLQGSVQITVSDAGESVSITLTASTDGGDQESITLTETDPGVFTGTIDLTPAAPVPGSGLLEVSDGVQISALYIDTSPEEQILATAGVDGAAPTFAGLDAALAGDGRVTLTWHAGTDPSTPLIYHVYRFLIPGGEIYDAPLASTNALIFIDEDVLNGTTYHYVVRAEDALGNGDQNTTERSATPHLPASIALDRDAYGPGMTMVIQVADSDSAGPLSVAITSGGGDEESLELAETSPGLHEGSIPIAEGGSQAGDGLIQVTGEMTVTVVYDDLDSGGQVTAEASVDAAAPAFGGLIAAEPASGEVVLSWDQGTDSHGPVAYRIYRSSSPGSQDFQSPLAETGATSHLDQALVNGTVYHYVVRAVDAFGNEDGNTVEVAAEPAEPVTWGALHHFTWSPVEPIQTMGKPFAVTITAQDAAGQTVRDFQGAADLMARIGNREQLGLITPATTSEFTDGVWTGEITPNQIAEEVSIRATALNNKRGDSAEFMIIQFVEPAVSISDAQVTEGETAALEFTVTLDMAAAESGSVQYATVSGSATSGEDFEAVTGEIVFSGSQTSWSVTVPVTDDLLQEGNETLTLVLTDPVGVTLSDAEGLGTIIDDDIPPALSISDAKATEGEAAELVFTLTLDAPAPGGGSLQYATVSGTATAGEDFETVAGEISFGGSQTSSVVTVPVTDDLLQEDAETLALILTEPIGITLSDAEGLGTIFDNDVPPAISVGDVEVVEGQDGISAAVFEIRLSTPAAGPVSVELSTSGASAKSPDDYLDHAETLVFPPGVTARSVSIEVRGDLAYERDESFRLRLGNSQGAEIAVGQAYGIILNDDLHPRFSAGDAALVEGDDGATVAQFTITMDGLTEEPAEVSYATVADSADAESDFIPVAGTLHFDPGVTELAVDVEVIGDAIMEPEESFTLVLSNPASATLERGTASAVIEDNDELHSAAIKLLLGHECSPQERLAADVNGDGRVDAADIVRAQIQAAEMR